MTKQRRKTERQKIPTDGKHQSAPPAATGSGPKTIAVIEDRMNRMQGEIDRLRHGDQPGHKLTAQSADIVEALASIATNTWRARNKMIDPENGEPLEDMRRVFRHVDGISNTLEELGLRTLDPAGKPYDSGMALKVIAAEETPGLSREEINETIKPSITWQGRLLQMGEVIVGTPAKEHATRTETSDE